MKLSMMAAVAVAVALIGSAAPTVSGNAEGSAGAAGTRDDANADPTGAPAPATLPDMCAGLPRNTVLSSCPAPCVADAPCIVYGQDANLTRLTGCDYGTATRQSFCTRAAGQAQTCEIHCFPPSPQKGSLAFQVRFSRTPLGQPTQRNRVENFNGGLDFYRTSYQVNNFVTAIGKLNASKNINDVYLAGDQGSTSSLGINLGDSPPDNRFVEVDVDAEVLSSAPAVKTVTLKDLPLGSDHVAEILSHAPPSVSELVLSRVDLTTLPDDMLAPMPNVQSVTMSYNPIPFVNPEMVMPPSLRTLDLSKNEIKTFDVEAPGLENLILNDNKLVRIPPVVFTLTNLRKLFISGNLIAQPLVLCQEQIDFLEGVYSKSIDLISPSSASRRATSASGDNVPDEDDLSQYLVNATSIYLFGYPWLPTLVVSSENARIYNDLLEQRAYPPPTNGIVPPPPTVVPSRTPTPPSSLVPSDLCESVQRKTLYTYCAGRCAVDGPCVAYDPNSPGDPSGCDYDVASATSYCSNFVGLARTCDFQCFPAFNDPSAFKFQIPFATGGYAKINRRTDDDGSFSSAKTSDIPFLADPFLNAIGPLSLSSAATEVRKKRDRHTRPRRDCQCGLFVAAQDVTSHIARSHEHRSETERRARHPRVFSTNTEVPESAQHTACRGAKGRTRAAAAIGNAHAQSESAHSNQGGGYSTAKAQEPVRTMTKWILVVWETRLTRLFVLENSYLSENVLTTIEIEAPSLVTLDLSGNNFVRVPPTVYSLTNLASLNLLDNPMALPLVVSQTQLKFLASIADLRLPQSTPTPTSKSPPVTNTNSTKDTVVSDGSELLVNGTAAAVGGVPVIVVSQTNSDRYNDLLQQKQKAASTKQSSGSTSSTGAPGSSSNGTSDKSTEIGAFNSSSSTNSTTGVLPTLPSDSTVGNSSAPSTRNAGTDNTGTTSGRNRSSLILLLVLSGFGSVLLVLIILLCLCIRHRRRGNSLEHGGEVYTALVDKAGGAMEPAVTSDEVIPWWTDDDMLSHRLRSADISDQHVIKDSGWGILWLVDYRGGTRQLVSKRLIQRDGLAHEARIIDLFAEAKIASTLNHPSIVQFVGVAWTNKTDLQVLYERLPNGDLGSYLAQTNASTLPWLPEKLLLAIDIVKALVYAHSFNPSLLHRDLKSANVLLDDNFKAKLGDFGSARLESDSNTMTSEVGTGRWLAPEILLGSTSYGASSDIYSFGVVLCELDTHQVPYAEEAKDADDSTLLLRVARGELRPSVSSSCPPEIRDIAVSCLAFEPSSRPTATQIAYLLRSLAPRKTHESLISTQLRVRSEFHSGHISWVHRLLV